MEEARAMSDCDSNAKAGQQWPRLSQQATLGATLLPRDPATPELHRLEAVQGRAARAFHNWLET